jgi:hypothetical protein
MKKLIPLGLTALAGTVAAGVIATQTPILADRGEEVVLRDDETPAVTQVDDDDDDDTLDRDRLTRDVASRASLRQADPSRSAAPRADRDNNTRDQATRQSRASRQVATHDSRASRQVATHNSRASRPEPASRDAATRQSRPSAASRG